MFTRDAFLHMAKTLPNHFDAVESTLNSLVFIDPNHTPTRKTDVYEGPKIEVTYTQNNTYTNSGSLYFYIRPNATFKLKEVPDYLVKGKVISWIDIFAGQFFKPNKPNLTDSTLAS